MSEEQMVQYDKNHEKMNRDIVERMAYQLLEWEKLRIFKRLIDKNVLKRAQYAVDLCRNLMNGTNVDRTDINTYRYADLLEAIYELGRKDYRDKALVHCMIAFLTSEMTREYYNCQYRRIKDSQDCLERFMGKSFGNKWLGEMLPKVKIGKEASIVDWAYIENAQIGLMCMSDTISVSKQGKSTEEKIYSMLIESLKRNRYFEVLGMFLLLLSSYKISGVREFVPKIAFELREEGKEVENENRTKENQESKQDCINVKSPDSNKIKLNYNISFETCKATFDIFGFIWKKWDAEEIGEIANDGMNKIVCSVDKIVEKSERMKEEQKEKIHLQIKNMLKEQLGEWVGDNTMNFPFYNLDMAYNVLKRARNRVHEDQIDVEYVYDEMKRVYGDIAAELYLEDEEYENNNVQGQSWYQKFIECPFIKKFGISFSKERCNGHSDLKDIPGDISEKMQEGLVNMIKTLQILGEKDDTPGT